MFHDFNKYSVYTEIGNKNKNVERILAWKLKGKNNSDGNLLSIPQKNFFVLRPVLT